MQRFGDLPIGARIRWEGDLYTKAEHDLREGHLQCSNALSDAGRWALIAPEQPVAVVWLPEP